MKNTNVQVVATIGPGSDSYEVLKEMIPFVDIVRFNFSWGDPETRLRQLALIRQLEQEQGKEILTLQDLPGPRIQTGADHTYDTEVISSITPRDREYIRFAVENNYDYIALSFVGGAADVQLCRSIITENGGNQRIIAKIERSKAVANLAEILASADAVMVARGDLGNEVPLEQIPFVQASIIDACRKAGKPVIVATQMLLSMTENSFPTRAEVTDVAYAVLKGTNATMLSEESARGTYPIEAVSMMKKIIAEAEMHCVGEFPLNRFNRIA